ncbi:MAG: YcnI family protein [Kyrpidia sp.]|nr:YcnI family protein [Kyrpidia sp.]
MNISFVMLKSALRRMRPWTAAAAAALVTAVAGVASAHVTVWPQQSSPGAFEKYTVRVPTEKAVPTVKIALNVPDGVAVEDLQPVPGWSHQMQKTNGRVTTLVWQATGPGIQPGEFQEFSFTAKNPSQPADLSWKAYQYYQDGSVVEWTGPKGTQTPASVTVIAAGGSAEPSAGAPASQSASAATAGGTSTAPGWVLWTALGLSAVSLILSLTAALRRR